MIQCWKGEGLKGVGVEIGEGEGEGKKEGDMWRNMINR